ncbi:MAG TPA: class I SAM-dependent methyltransferase [Microvirga sp.]|nr:class I SAM-dependent methyltransferase [Microvirga sp.]
MNDQPLAQSFSSNERVGGGALVERIAYRSCPLCESVDIPVLVKADCSRHPLYKAPLSSVMQWHRCDTCKHVFTSGYFTPEALSIVFGGTHENQRVGHDFERQRHVSGRMVQQVARHVPDGDWLDVGFGNGSLIFTADEFGFTAVGIDLRVDNVEGLKRAGFEAHCVDMTELDMPGRFSVISMADVLEHIPFPKEALSAARRLLRPGGVLFLSMPNMGAFAWRALDSARANPYWGELEHYHNFTRDRLYLLLEEHGFTPREYGISERYRVCMEVIAMRNHDRESDS